jgi:hypothetical protein
MDIIVSIHYDLVRGSIWIYWLHLEFSLYRSFSPEWWFSLPKFCLLNDCIPQIFLWIYQSVPNWRHEVLIQHLIKMICEYFLFSLKLSIADIVNFLSCGR